MILKLKSLELCAFKGIKNGRFEFGNGTTTVTGSNGTGKSTLFTAWLWLTCDRDVDLTGNPDIRPIDAAEATPRVTAVLDIDGKTVKICKYQKRSVSKPNAEGISKISLTNSYEINDVPKTEKDFRSQLAAEGIDWDRFLALSHMDVFTSGKKEEQRKVLFEMASSRSDYDVAQITEGAEDVAKMLADYSLEEISAMQKATQRKILEFYGKNGEVLRAKIEGLELAKVDIDVSAIELGKADVKRKLEACRAQQNDLDATSKEYTELSDQIMKIRFEMGDLVRKAATELADLKSKKTDEIRSLSNKRETTLRDISDRKYIISSIDRETAKNKERIEDLRKAYTAEKELKFDESKAVCPVCKRTYDEGKISDLMAEYESHKASHLNDITIEGNGLSKRLKALAEQKTAIEAEIEALNATVSELEPALAAAKKELASYPEDSDATVTSEYKALEASLAEKTNKLSLYDVADRKTALKREEEALQNELTEYEKQLAKFSGNERIDEQIDELRKQQSEYEQNKADAEKILYQIDLVSRRKNELLTDEINSHFEIAKFGLFEYQKNGSYKETVNVFVDGRQLGTSTNTGREVLAKLDIIKGLQKFYRQYLPVFIDGAECLSADTNKRIELGTQRIDLIVSENSQLEVHT